MKKIEGITTPTFNIELQSDNDIFEFSLDVNVEEPGLEFVKLTMTSDYDTVPTPVKLTFTYPGIKVHSKWNPKIGFSRGVVPDWYMNVSDTAVNSSNAVSGAPIEVYLSYEGDNRLTLAFSDALNPVDIITGVNEESADILCSTVLFSEPMAPISRYEGCLRLDIREIPYYDSIKQVQQWWAKMPGYKPSKVPWQGVRPVYSTWYNFHQNVNAEEVINQCKLAKELGFESVIIDDGWQTEDNSRGYSYCGDWKVAACKIPDIKEFVSSIHKIGMKILLWYSVPFIGRNSKKWEQFQGKFLNPEKTDWCVLDPRFPEVREYLISTYEEAVKNWDLDGFKLDFVDEFTTIKCTDYSLDTGRDYKSVPEAVDRLLKDIMQRVKQIKSDIMIEFRQTYIGPLMSTYGNIFRATDCPNDSLTNRIRVIDVRLLSSENTATHSDMIMWSNKDTVESAAMQIINVLYSVPQISVLIDKIPSEHYKMLKFWMKFWLDNRDVLMEGKFMPLHPEANYSMVMGANSKKLIIVVYSNPLIELPEELPEEIIIVNGMYKNKLIIESSKDLGVVNAEVLDCCGDTICSGVIDVCEGINALEVPTAGVVRLIRKQ